MNCKQFNTIPLEEVLLSLGHLPTKQNEKEAWYLSPFASENQASFKLDKRQNLWFLHSEGIGGNNTDFMQKYLNASVSEVLSWAEKQDFSSFHQQEKLLTFPKTIQKPEYQITGIHDLQNQNLKNYLQERGLSEAVYLFLNNDRTGLKCKSEILQSFPHAIDSSELYSNHKDLNEYLVHKIKAEKSVEAKHPSESLQESRGKIERQESESKQGFKRKR